jgi:ribonuclease HI
MGRGQRRATNPVCRAAAGSFADPEHAFAGKLDGKEVAVVDLIDEKAINIYTDGSSFSHPRRGGVGIRFVHVGDDGYEVIEDVSLPGYQSGTNQEMELQACIEALQMLRRGRTDVPIEKFDKILIHTDSQYVVNYHKSALFEWQSNHWTTRDGVPVVNARLWNELIREMHKAGKRVEFTWVKGHKDSPHNKAVDKLAKQSAKLALRDPLHVEAVRRKRSTLTVQPGCVPVRGQEMAIRIIDWRSLRRRGLCRYRYEVVDHGDASFGKIDFIYSDADLRAGHMYQVRVNDDPKNPRIVEILCELDDQGRAIE